MASLCISRESVMWVGEFSSVNILKHTGVFSFNKFYEDEGKMNQFNSLQME